MMLLSAALLWTTAAPVAVKWGVPALMACVAAWLWARPEA
jgi:hypothetical protein